jgi:hypothetical protein
MQAEGGAVSDAGFEYRGFCLPVPEICHKINIPFRAGLSRKVAKPQREKGGEGGRNFDRIYSITGIEEGSARGKTEAFDRKRVRAAGGLFE